MPSRSSRATRTAISSRVSPLTMWSAIPPDRHARALHDTVHVDGRRADQLRVELARLYHLFDFRDDEAGGRRHHRVEVPPSLSVDEVPHSVCLLYLYLI